MSLSLMCVPSHFYLENKIIDTKGGLFWHILAVLQASGSSVRGEISGNSLPIANASEQSQYEAQCHDHRSDHGADWPSDPVPPFRARLSNGLLLQRRSKPTFLFADHVREALVQQERHQPLLAPESGSGRRQRLLHHLHYDPLANLRPRLLQWRAHLRAEKTSPSGQYATRGQRSHTVCNSLFKKVTTYRTRNFVHK